MKFWFQSVSFFLIHIFCHGKEWPVPRSIKCLSSGAFHCKENGQFENPFDSTCSSYFICEGTAEELIEAYRTCPNNSLYDPIRQECSANYTCICDEDQNSTTITTTATITSTQSTTIRYPNEFTTEEITGTSIDDSITTSKPCSIGENLTCTETGRFAYPNNSSCLSYFNCYHLSDDQPKKYIYRCFGTSSAEGGCNLSYTCPCSEKSEDSTPTASEISTIMRIDYAMTSETSTTMKIDDTNSTLSKYCESGRSFTCTKTGYYANSNDSDCKSYYYCYLWSDGRVRQYAYNCSVGLFNPHKDSCDTTYKCPCSGESGGYYSQESTTTTSLTTTIKPPVPSVLPETPKYCSIGGIFTCTKTGRFANPDDPSCNSYIFCYLWSDGKVRQYSYNCSKGLFSPSKGKCDPFYICPCSQEIQSETSRAYTSEANTISSPTSKNCALGENFKCSETGRFADPNDTTCKSYFYCFVWSNRTIGQYSYTCSVGHFNPNKGSCDSTYVCPCTEEPTTVPSTITSSSTYVAPTTTTPAATTTTPAATTASTTTPEYCAVGGNFTCSETGRFANPNDTTCKSYFYCYVFSSGKIGQYSYTCSVGLFNPSKGSCDRTYVCPCTEEPTTVPSTITSSPTSVAPTTTTPVTTTTTPAATTAGTTTPEYCAVGGNFTCSETGRFANPNDTTCKSYFYCYVFSSGKIGQYSYTCSVGLFNPSKGSCDSTYVCPCTEEPTTVPSTITSSPTSVAPTTTTPVTTTTTPAATTAGTTTPEYCAVGGNLTCSETGRFANPNDTTCKSYFYCYVFPSGKIGQYSYTCSVGLFNPSKGSCDSTYVCPCTEEPTTVPSTITSSPTSVAPTTTTPVTTTTTPAATTAGTTTPEYCAVGGNFTCSETGRFANPNDTTCKSYFYCYVFSSGKIGQYSYTCSVGLFNPSKGSCDRTYVCPCTEEPTTVPSTITSSPTSVAPTTTTPVTTTTTPAATTAGTTTPEYCAYGGNFTCSETGRFANPNDTTCKSYFYCYVFPSGKIGQYSYTCSVGLFNPSKGSCDSTYVCPCTEETTTVRSTIASSPTSVAPTPTTPAATTAGTTTPEYCAVGGNFTCSETGRFANPNDTICKSYFYCYVSSRGTIGPYSYTCSKGLFNPIRGACDPAYVCPCTE